MVIDTKQLRIELAQLCGWTDIRQGKHGQVHGVGPDGDAGTLPNPVDHEDDAAELRAELVRQGLCVSVQHDYHTGRARQDVGLGVWFAAVEIRPRPADAWSGRRPIIASARVWAEPLPTHVPANPEPVAQSAAVRERLATALAARVALRALAQKAVPA